MKKIVSVFLILLSLNAKALTLKECQSYSDATIAKEFITAIRLGAMGSFGSRACLKQANSLKVQLVSEEDEGSAPLVLKQDDRIRLINVVKNDRVYTAIYEIIASSGKTHRGEFSFFRTSSLADEDSINTFKCGYIANEPSLNFIDERCNP